jgi:integrase
VTQQRRFLSALATLIERYVALKRALGRRFDDASYQLARLDRFLASEQAPDLTAATFSAWCASLQHLSASTRRKEMMVVHGLCLYRRRSEPACFVPDPSQFPPSPPRSRPHIFAETEIARLLAATDALPANAPSPLQREVARLAVVLLYTTGIRRGELVRLALADYDSAEHVLQIRVTKFFKSRLVPLSSDAALEMDRYLAIRLRPGFPRAGDTPLLLNGHGGLTGYTGGGFGSLMRKLFRQTGIRAANGRSPRVHDLRFTFAVRALLRWYHAGVEVQARLPALAAYMGHASVASTQYYLPSLDEVIPVASERFERHCAGFLPTACESGGSR